MASVGVETPEENTLNKFRFPFNRAVFDGDAQGFGEFRKGILRDEARGLGKMWKEVIFGIDGKCDGRG